MKKKVLFLIPMIATIVLLFMLRATGMKVHIAVSVIGLILLIGYTLATRKEWRKIIKQSNAKIIKESGYHYKTFKNRLIDVIKNPKYLFKPIALYTFLLEERNI